MATTQKSSDGTPGFWQKIKKGLASITSTPLHRTLTIIAAGAYGAFLIYLLARMRGAEVDDLTNGNSSVIYIATQLLFGATSAGISVFLLAKTSLEKNFGHAVCLAIISGMVWPVILENAIGQVTNNSEEAKKLYRFAAYGQKTVTELSKAAESGNTQDFVNKQELLDKEQENAEVSSDDREHTAVLKKTLKNTLTETIASELIDNPTSNLEKQFEVGFKNRVFAPEDVFIQPVRAVLHDDVANADKTAQLIQKGITEWESHQTDEKNLSDKLRFYGAMSQEFEKAKQPGVITSGVLADVESDISEKFVKLSERVGEGDTAAVSELRVLSRSSNAKLAEIASNSLKRFQNTGVLAQSVGFEGEKSAGLKGGAIDLERQAVDVLLGKAGSPDLTGAQKLYYRYRLELLRITTVQDFEEPVRKNFENKIDQILGGNLNPREIPDYDELENERHLRIYTFNDDQRKFGDQLRDKINEKSEWFCRSVASLDPSKAPSKTEVRLFSKSTGPFSDMAKIKKLLKHYDLENAVRTTYVPPSKHAEQDESEGRFELWFSKDFVPPH